MAAADNSLAYPKLPILYRVDQPSSNVVVFRGANVALAKAHGIIPSGKGGHNLGISHGGHGIRDGHGIQSQGHVHGFSHGSHVHGNGYGHGLNNPGYPGRYSGYPRAPIYASTTYEPTTTPAPTTTPTPYTTTTTPAPTTTTPYTTTTVKPTTYAPPAPPSPPIYTTSFKAQPTNKQSYSSAPKYNAYDYAPIDANYDWEYAVKEHYNDFGHKESRNGYAATGKYYVALPDGRFQTVTYVADEKGFRPAVVYEGTAAYPEDKPSYGKPSYSA